jgi:hypothetical protein
MVRPGKERAPPPVIADDAMTQVASQEGRWRAGVNRQSQPEAQAHQVAASHAAALKRKANAMSDAERKAKEAKHKADVRKEQAKDPVAEKERKIRTTTGQVITSAWSGTRVTSASVASSVVSLPHQCALSQASSPSSCRWLERTTSMATSVPASAGTMRMAGAPHSMSRQQVSCHPALLRRHPDILGRDILGRRTACGSR